MYKFKEQEEAPFSLILVSEGVGAQKNMLFLHSYLQAFSSGFLLTYNKEPII